MIILKPARATNGSSQVAKRLIQKLISHCDYVHHHSKNLYSRWHFSLLEARLQFLQAGFSTPPLEPRQQALCLDETPHSTVVSVKLTVWPFLIEDT